MSRTTSQASTVTSTTTNGHVRSLSAKTNIKAAARSNPLPPSDIKLFVTNLRLLDLDIRTDWPNITVQTFSSKNADQKQRIGASEWALFRLFEIWDPAETNQLRPFFPPLEPLQSRNLRIALHRSLDTLKKEGVLGREAVLRKTMMDECKGDKFFEVLCMFSTAVLKKVQASKPSRKKATPAVANRLANAQNLSSHAQDSLIPLSIVHKASLSNVLKRKDEKRTRFAQFEELLDSKADSINQRLRKSKETPKSRKPAMSEKEVDSFKQQLKDSWIGDQKWIDVMLHGDDVQAEGAFLARSFRSVWRAIEQGLQPEEASPDMGLMENLQSRVQEQQTRLSRWKSFHAEFQAQGSAPSESDIKPTVAVKEFKFDDHLQLQLPKTFSKNECSPKASLRPEFESILSEMDEELSRVATAKHNRSSLLRSRRQRSSLESPIRQDMPRKTSRSGIVPPVEQLRPMKPSPPSEEQYQESVPARQLPVYLRTSNLATPPVDSELTLVAAPSTYDNATIASHSSESLSDQDHSPHAPNLTSDPLPTITTTLHQQPVTSLLPSPSPTPSPSSSPPSAPSYFPSEPPLLEAPQLTSEETLAAQIVSTIGDATPSPVKKKQPRLSLMERTRMSMSNTNTFQPIPESPPLPSPSLPTAYEDDEEGLPTTATRPQQSLLERTRQSMATMNPPKPRASLAPPQHRDMNSSRRKSSRQSIFPVNQFDTPRSRKSIQAIEESQTELESTPKEDLFSDEVDYDRVFKSRPKIATSPVFGTPLVIGGAGDADEDEFDEGVTGVDLADVDSDDDVDVQAAWADSPSRDRGVRRGVRY
ncbi:unnamed protein product [Periconia digitata]|uniref:HAUS augmin-like complex subunit 6 N-terminal domain-containing protein n=1 Tax=Periconia digitata TaxID=1303443 RepID=A0A9W4ULE7_9PLEO|nr:unnamed protein product [Periconia digitata]